MQHYVGRDLSMEKTSVCVLGQEASLVFEGRTSSRPQAIAKILRRRAPNVERIVFETGSLSSWLWHELKAQAFRSCAWTRVIPKPRSRYG